MHVYILVALSFGLSHYAPTFYLASGDEIEANPFLVRTRQIELFAQEGVKRDLPLDSVVAIRLSGKLYSGPFSSAQLLGMFPQMTDSSARGPNRDASHDVGLRTGR